MKLNIFKSNQVIEMLAVGYVLIIAGVYTIMGLITAYQFRKDKLAAENNQWRTPEKQLLFLMYAFGVFGAAVAMKAFRHKTNKPLFQGSLTISMVLHFALIIYLMTIIY